MEGRGGRFCFFTVTSAPRFSDLGATILRVKFESERSLLGMCPPLRSRGAVSYLGDLLGRAGTRALRLRRQRGPGVHRAHADSRYPARTQLENQLSQRATAVDRYIGRRAIESDAKPDARLLLKDRPARRHTVQTASGRAGLPALHPDIASGGQGLRPGPRRSWKPHQIRGARHAPKATRPRLPGPGRSSAGRSTWTRQARTGRGKPA